MNNKALNKEFGQMIRNKKQISKTGFTDSEEEENSKSARSPKSGRSSLSGRSLLSGRSPREEKIVQFRKNEQNNYSIDKSEDENSPRRLSYSTKGKQLSPKSPRSFEDSSLKYPKISHSRSHSRDDDDDMIFGTKRTPRSPHSPRSDRDNLENIDLMKTMKKPINTEKFLKTKRIEEKDDYDYRKSRVTTPTKDSFYKRKESGLNAKTNFYSKRMHSKENDILEENSRSGKTTPTRSDSRHDIDEELISKHSQSPRFMHFKSESPKSLGRSHSPSDADENSENEQKNEETNNLNLQDRSDLKLQNERKFSPNLEKDPEVEETIEDKKISQKLQLERERKRLSREARTKNMTDSSKKIEDAIEQVENTMEDSLRLKNLKELTKELKYPSKPSLEEMLRMERNSRNRNQHESEASRTRSLSASSRGGRHFSKYSNIKPRTQTRLEIQSARFNDEFNSSKLDMMNDSASLRENIYTEWYLKKMQDAQQKLKEAKLAQKNQEEKKAQELIEKLQKSKLIFEIWKEKKDQMIGEKRKSLKKNMKSPKEIEEEKLEKKKEAEIAFKEWTRKKKEFEQEQKEEKLTKERENEKKKRTETKKPPRPPVSYDVWENKKKEQIKEKLDSKKKEERKKEEEEMKKRKKKELAQKSFYEWLDKKELTTDIKNSKSMSTSMNSLPPFYPTSKIIPFGR